MPQKSKASRGAKKASSKSQEKTQSERFIETAREIGVDESGKEFERALKRVVPPRKGSSAPK